MVKSEVATFFDVFPDGTGLEQRHSGQGLRRRARGARDAADDRHRFDAGTHLGSGKRARRANRSSEVGFNSALSLLGTYGGQARDLAPWLADAEINRDSNLRLQYLAGMSLNEYENASIYDQMLKYRRFPENLFVGTPVLRDVLRQTLNGPSGP